MRRFPKHKTLAFLGVALALVLGATSLLLLVVFLYRGSFEFFSFGLSPLAALAWDSLLCAAFFLQHSGMVRRAFQQRLGRFVPAPYHGVVYTIASGSVLIVCVVLWQRAGEPLLSLNGARQWAIRALFFLAMAGFAWGILALKSFDTFGVKPALARLRGSDSPHHPFVIRGPYRWVRHPLYLFAILLFWACPMVTPDRLLFNVLWTLWVILATMLEERDLVSDFGDSYTRYQSEVPMIFPWRMPARRT